MDIKELLVFLSILPSIILGKYIYDNDRISKEPSNLLIRLAVSGVLSAILTLVISFIVELIPGVPINYNHLGTIGLFFYCLFKVALIEEFSKWIFVKTITWNNKEFDHIYDAVVYCVFVSLGFATIENVLYVFYGGIWVALLRAFLSVPSHAFFGVFMGYYYGISKQGSINNNKRIEQKNLTLSLVMPVLLHGFFDFILLSSKGSFIIFYFAFVILLYIKSFKKIKQLSNIKENFTNTSNILYCSNCGAKLSGPYCANCGKKMY